MSYTLRRRKQNVVYTDSDKSESDLDNHEQDDSRPRPIKPTKKRRTRLSTPRATETDIMDSGLDLIVRPGWGRRRNRSKTTREGEQNKESSEVGHGPSMERSSRLPEGPSPSGENILPSPEGQSSSMKKVSSLPEGTSSRKKTIFSWLIDCKLIEEDEQVYYQDDTKASVAMTGRITRDGILCSCCQKEISIWTFEKHADSDLKQPYGHIYLHKKGTYLQDYLIAAWLKATERKSHSKETSINQNDDVCSICGNGGDLFSCEKCPSTFHAYCMNMKRAPCRDWLCPHCVCKHCELDEDKQFIKCPQCDKIFHLQCFINKFPPDSMDIRCSKLYCSPNCKEIYEKLESSLASKTDITQSYTWRVIRPTDMGSKLHSARTKYWENNSKVAVAFMLMNESFKTITDRHTGINVVQSVLYSRGSNLTRVNFSRFYTFVLEEDDAIICAASIRIHGGEVAEMPFIATEERQRRHGICRMLMTVIESFLRDLKVQNLIIPSTPDTSEMWKQKFGFKELTRKLKKVAASHNILTFPHALKLYKDLSSHTAELDGNKGNEDKQMEDQNAQETEKDNQDKQTENQNAQDTEKDNAERPFPDLNMDISEKN